MLLYKINFFFFYKKYKIFYLFFFKNYYLFFFIKRFYFIWYKFLIFTKVLNYYSLFLISVIKNKFIFNSFCYNNLFYYYYEFFVDGLYYRVKYYKNYNILGFILGFNHYILYKSPRTVKACVHMKKRRFFLYSLNLILLGNLSSELVNLKYPNLFKGKGLKIIYKQYRKKNLIKKTK
jgi:hypothetical protein